MQCFSFEGQDNDVAYWFDTKIKIVHKDTKCDVKVAQRAAKDILDEGERRTGERWVQAARVLVAAELSDD